MTTTFAGLPDQSRDLFCVLEPNPNQKPNLQKVSSLNTSSGFIPKTLLEVQQQMLLKRYVSLKILGLGFVGTRTINVRIFFV